MKKMLLIMLTVAAFAVGSQAESITTCYPTPGGGQTCTTMQF